MSLVPLRQVPGDYRAWVRWNDRQSAQGFIIYRLEATTYTVQDDDDVVIVDDDTAGGAVTVTLPPAANNKGRWVYIKKIGTTGSVTTDADGSETIDGVTTLVNSTQYQSDILLSDGVEWWTL